MQERLGIVGGGAIATGLAAVAAEHGEVAMWVRSDASAERTRGALELLLDEGDGSAARIHVSTDPRELADATFAVEAIVEDHDEKVAQLQELDRLLDPSAILGTTTSSLSITELATASGRPERFVGFHVFNPVRRMQLIELAYPPQASDEVRGRSSALCESLGKTAVEVPDVPGFVVNRLLFPYLFGAVRLLEETGMAARDVDTCMKLGAGHPMGPLALLDFVGLDVSVAIGDSIGVEVPARLRALVAEGALGRKSGRGLLTYDKR